MSLALRLIALLIIPLINLMIGASLFPLNKSSVALIVPANSSRSNESSNSSAISLLLSSSFVKLEVNKSLKSLSVYLIKLKTGPRNL